ncbi:hypothetical protein ACXWOS_10685, partial [Streptococcus pyogenes]
MLTGILALWRLSGAIALAVLIFFLFRLDHHLKANPNDPAVRYPVVSSDTRKPDDAVRERVEPTGGSEG